MINRYKNTPILKTSSGTRYYKDVKYPQIPLSVTDIYVISTDGDRFDLLAAQYYSDSSLWWVISIANDQLPQNSLYIPKGSQIRIPINPSDIVSSFNTQQ